MEAIKKIELRNQAKLALYGGPKTITHNFNKYNPIGIEELNAAKTVIESGNLSQFLGTWHADFYGGPKVREFEANCAAYFKVNHCVTVNSWTSGLIASVGAIGIEPGDEIIVSPWTMSASATAILHWNAIPVFADIEPDNFCLDPAAVEANISPYTKAILAVDIFGQSADMATLRAIAKKYNLKIISDSAQSPGSMYKDKFTGTLADIGGYSLNYHKHIHTGEGGILLTDDAELAEKLKLIRNHAEAVVEAKGHCNLTNMIGYNFRLGEIECAIGIEQLKKLKTQVFSRQQIVKKLSTGLKDLPGLTLPSVRPSCTHVYYVFPLILDNKLLGVNRADICAALSAEGVTGIGIGYQNLHLLPLYQNKIAYGSKGFPWTADFCHRDIDYRKGICPIAESLHDTCFFSLSICAYEYSDADIDAIICAFQKVWNNLDYLKEKKPWIMK